MVNVLSLDAGETITAAVAVPAFDDEHYCIMATRLGRIKRIALSDFASVRPSGLIAIKLDEGDELDWARLTNGTDDLILVTEQGQALRFSERRLRSMGRNAAGVTAIKLAKGDHVTSMEVVEPGGDLLVISSCGYGKRTPLTEYPVRGRATGGVKTINQKRLKQDWSADSRPGRPGSRRFDHHLGQRGCSTHQSERYLANRSRHPRCAPDGNSRGRYRGIDGAFGRNLMRLPTELWDITGFAQASPAADKSAAGQSLVQDTPG